MVINFRKKEDSRANKIYFYTMFEGGDADTRHPQEFEMKGITFANYQEHIAEIEKEVNLHKQLKDILRNHSDDKRGGYAAAKEISDELADMYDNVPNDPQCDYQFKCSLSYTKLIGYDETGTKYEHHF